MKIKGRDSKKPCWIMVIVIFYWLFAPPIFGKHSSFFVAAFSWLYIFWNNKYLFKRLNFNRLLIIYVGIIAYLLWVSIFAFGFGGSKIPVYHSIYWIISIIPCSVCLCIHTKKKGQNIEYLLRLVLWAALIQSLLSILAFLYNPIKLLFIDKLQADDTLVMETYTYEIYYRLFGFSAGLTFDMPSIMALLACVGIYLGAKANWKYYFFVPTIAFSAMINARTSMVILFVGIVVFVLTSIKLSEKTLVMMIVFPIVAIIVLVYGSSVLKNISPLTYGWVESGFNQILGFFRNETDSGYFEYLLDTNKWIIPSGVNLLFGTGYRVIGGSPFGVCSDIGYINDLWLGGILYTLILYSISAISIFKTQHFCIDIKDKRIVVFVTRLYIVLLPILNLKTPIISMGSITTFLIGVMIYSALQKKNEL